MEEFDINRVCLFDVETTGLPVKGLKWDNDFNNFPYVVQIAWIFDGKEYDFIIKPEGYEIPEESTKIHGITTEHALSVGVPFADIIVKFIECAKKASLICAHNIYFDTSIIKANILRYWGREYYDNEVDAALDKSKRIDTMRSTIKFVGAVKSNGNKGKYAKLVELFEKLFPGDQFNEHNALDDVRALKRCLEKLIELGIITIDNRKDAIEELNKALNRHKTILKDLTDLLNQSDF